MRTKNYVLFLIAILAINACKKPASPTVYKSLGTYSSSGQPAYLTNKDSISDGLELFADTTLPAGKDIRISHPELLNTNADIKISQTSDVYVTFISQGSGLTISMGFYIYQTDKPPKSPKDVQTITYIFPNSGLNTTLQAGDKVKIGTFEAGTSIGFVLLQGGWDLVKETLDSNVPHFWTTDILNPEADVNLKKHAILLKYPQQNKSLICFEDFDRTKPACDNDFNDQIILCTTNP